LFAGLLDRAPFDTGVDYGIRKLRCGCQHQRKARQQVHLAPRLMAMTAIGHDNHARLPT
jgi:hypothetical protein